MDKPSDNPPEPPDPVPPRIVREGVVPKQFVRPVYETQGDMPVKPKAKTSTRYIVDVGRRQFKRERYSVRHDIIMPDNVTDWTYENIHSTFTLSFYESMTVLFAISASIVAACAMIDACASGSF